MIFNIYRNLYLQVNRFHHMSLENGEEGNTKAPRPSSKYIDSSDRVDLITELLMHNMVEVAERIFDLLGLRQTWLCRQVSIGQMKARLPS